MADQYRGNVTLGLHCDGADASTTFTDITGKTVTANGNAQIDTAQFKFGTASGLFDGSGDYLTVAHSTGFSADADFTAECWVKPTNTSALRFILDKRSSGATNREWFLYMGSGGTVSFAVFSTTGATLATATSTATLSTSAFTHLELTKSGTTWRLFINGTLDGSAAESGGTYGTNTNQLTIGRDVGNAPGRDWNGWIDDIRLTNGVARHTATFTAPTAAFDDDGPTFAIAATSTFTPETQERSFSSDGTSAAAFVARTDSDFAFAGTSDFVPVGYGLAETTFTLPGTSETSFGAGVGFAIAGTSDFAPIVHGIVTASTTIEASSTVSLVAFSDYRSRYNAFGRGEFRVEVTYEKFISTAIQGRASTSFKSSFESFSDFSILGQSLVQGRSPLQPLGYAFECAPQFVASDWLDIRPESTFRIRGRSKFRPRWPQGRCVRVTAAGTSRARFVGKSAASSILSVSSSGASSWVSA